MPDEKKYWLTFRRIHFFHCGTRVYRQSADESWMAPRRTGVSGHLHIGQEAGAADSGQELERSKSGVEFERLCAGCDLLAQTVCFWQRKVMVARSNRKCEKSGTGQLVRGSHPNVMDLKHCGGMSLTVLWDEVFGICEVEGVCLDRNARQRDCAQISSSKQMLGEMGDASPRKTALEHREIDQCGRLFCGARAWTTVKAERDNVIGVKRFPWMEVDQWWRLWHRTGHGWDRGVQHEFPGSHQRAIVLLGWTCGQNGTIRRSMRKLGDVEGLPWWRWASTLQRGRERQMSRTRIQNGLKIYSWKGTVTTGVSKVCLNADGFCRICTTIGKLATNCSESCATAAFFSRAGTIKGFAWWREASSSGFECVHRYTFPHALFLRHSP